MGHDKCSINSTEINFLKEATNSSMLSLKRWMKFCKTVYVEDCDLYSLSPPLTNIPKMLERSTYDDCFNNRNLIIYCISMILSVAIIFANGVVIISFARYRNLLTSTNLPILSLALSDILTGISFMYSTTWNLVLLTASYKFDITLSQHLVSKRSNYYLCLTFDGSGVLFTCMMSSVLTLGIIATQRYIALFYPYTLNHLLTIPKIIFAIVSTWAVSIAVGILPLSGWNTWKGKCQLSEVLDFSYIILWSAICFVSGIIMLFIYIRIFVLTRKHTRQILSTQVTSTSSCSFQNSAERQSTAQKLKSQIQEAEQQMGNDQQHMTPQNANYINKDTATSVRINVQPSNPSDDGIRFASPSPSTKDNTVRTDRSSSILSDGVKTVQRGSKQFIKRPSKAVVTTAMILGAFYICWTPFLICLLVFHKGDNNLLTYYLAVVTQVNSVFNPITYGLRNSDIKTAIKKLFKCDRH